MTKTINPDLDEFLTRLETTEPERFWGSTIPDLIALVDREMPKLQALRIINSCWAQLHDQLEDEPTADELRGWIVLSHVRDYLENRP